MPLKPSPFSVASRLPAAYLKFQKQVKATPAPVHYIQEPKWQFKPGTKEKKRVENVPIPLKFPKEMDEGIWGGEAVVQGFIKPKLKRRRFPNFWVPVLKRSVVYSEILNKHMSVTVTERTLRLIDKHCGFDNYVLETPVQDLKSQLALDIRRHMLLALANKEVHHEDPEKQQKVFEKYQKFAIPKEEAEWFGLTMREAIKKQRILEEVTKKRAPLKHECRAKFIEELEAFKAKESESSLLSVSEGSVRSWLARLNPFGKKEE